jgi:5-formyltetrahydrofolate cyclo-ligase
MRSRRRRLARAEQAVCAHRVAHHLVTTPLFLRSQRIAFYLAHEGELDPYPLMARAWALGKVVYLPVLRFLGGRHLRFAQYRSGDTLRRNRFGIPEPLRPPSELARAQDLDLVLAPLVAFDAWGHRLGMGGGFYDRTLGFLQHRLCWHRPRLVGLAYSFQEVSELPVSPWDVPLQGIVTELGFRATPYSEPRTCSTGC